MDDLSRPKEDVDERERESQDLGEESEGESRADVSDSEGGGNPSGAGSEDGGSLTPEEELAALREEVAALRDKNLRLVAEGRNLHQRSEREKREGIKYAAAEFARDLLVVIDDVERALEAGEKAGEGAKPVADGVRIVYEHFLKILRDRGIEPVASVGETFDPDVHEAMLQQPSEEHEAGVVIQELARGYRMHERVLRPARVIVSSGPAGEGTE